MSKVVVYYNPDKAERLGVNLGNMAAYIGKNTAIQYVKGGISGALLGTLPEIYLLDEFLSIDGEVSPYDTAPLEIARNVMVLSTQDDAVSMVFYDVTMNVKQTNEIVTTPILKRTGSIKEFIQSKDYEISVRGSLIGLGRTGFPYDMMVDLIKLLKTPETLKVANKYLMAFDIANVVVGEAEFKQQEQKHMNILPFTINLKSDENYELEIE